MRLSVACILIEIHKFQENFQPYVMCIEDEEPDVIVADAADTGSLYPVITGYRMLFMSQL